MFFVQIEVLHSRADWNKGFSDYAAKRRKLTEAISLQYTVKRGVTLRSTAEWEKENTLTHTSARTQARTY